MASPWVLRLSFVAAIGCGHGTTGKPLQTAQTEPPTERPPASIPSAAETPFREPPTPPPLGAKAVAPEPSVQPPPIETDTALPPAPSDTDAPFRNQLEHPRSAAGPAATRHANLSPASCRADLKKRKLPTTPARGAARGIATPLRINGQLHSIRFVTPGAKSRYGMLDCRLVLALDEMAEVLAKHSVVAVRIDNFYRPVAHLPGRRIRSQHAYGLAADIVGFTLADGRSLLVERDYRGGLGSPSCGPESAIADPTDEAIALRNIVCELAAKGIFHHMLTPNYDRAHQDHLHFDIKRGDRAVIVR
jgi:hypothetical protein